MNEIPTNIESLDQALPIIEAVIFASGDPISVDRIATIVGCEEALVNSALEVLSNRYSVQNELYPASGLELVNINGMYQIRTKAMFAEILRGLKEEKPKRLSIAALETLAIIAYRQPIVKSEVEAIRGVDATPTIKTLLERGIIKIVGHQSTVGNPALYGTTDEFLKLFSLGSLAELPTLREITEIVQDPGEDFSDDDNTSGNEVNSEVSNEVQ